jgi:hypothetical protein
MAALDPPKDAQTAHDTAVAALSRSADAVPPLVTGLHGAESLDDISALINGSAYGDGRPRVTAACLELESVALGLGVTADLSCGESGDAESSQ